MAAAAALRAVSGVQPPPNGELAANIAHAAENIADHLTHFYLFFMPDFARDFYAGEEWFPAVEARFKAVQGAAAQEVLPARARLLHVMGLIAGKWPHSLAIQPGGVTRALDLGEQNAAHRRAGRLPRLFGKNSVRSAARTGRRARRRRGYSRIFRDGQGDFPAFLRLAASLRLDALGKRALPLISFGAYDSAAGSLFARRTFTIRAQAKARRCRAGDSGGRRLFLSCARASPIRRGP